MKPRSAVALAGLASLALSACASGTSAPPQPGSMIRQSVATAPADLQLLCSAAAARTFDLDRNEILPVGSDAVSPGIFRVDVQSGGGTIRCIVNRQAEILELVRV